MTVCKHCGKPLFIGREAIEMEQYASGVYCSKDCAIEELKDSIDLIYEDVAYDVVIEEEDPYARYGVSRGDFF